MSDGDFAPLNDSAVNTDDFFDLLSNSRRQYVLSYLQKMNDDVVELPELVEWVLTQEANRASDQWDAIVIGLHHIHLPKLADCGLIDYDARSGTIRYDRHPDREQRVALAVELTGGFS